jgi:hypothetical protein
MQGHARGSTTQANTRRGTNTLITRTMHTTSTKRVQAAVQAGSAAASGSALPIDLDTAHTSTQCSHKVEQAHRVLRPISRQPPHERSTLNTTHPHYPKTSNSDNRHTWCLMGRCTIHATSHHTHVTTTLPIHSLNKSAGASLARLAPGALSAYSSEANRSRNQTPKPPTPHPHKTQAKRQHSHARGNEHTTIMCLL